MDLDRPRFQTFGWVLWLAGLFSVLTLLVVARWTQGFDDSWNAAMVNLEVQWLLDLAEVLHRIGGVPVASLTVTFVTVVFVVTRRWWFAAAWLAIIGVAQMVTTVVKLLVGRERPIDALVHESSAAYPSGHASVSGAAIAIGLAVLVGFLWPHRYRLFMLIGAAYAITMAWSRTYLHAHWFTDVVGGVILGTAIVLAVALTMGDKLAQRTHAD